MYTKNVSKQLVIPISHANIKFGKKLKNTEGLLLKKKLVTTSNHKLTKKYYSTIEPRPVEI